MDDSHYLASHQQSQEIRRMIHGLAELLDQRQRRRVHMHRQCIALGALCIGGIGIALLKYIQVSSKRRRIAK